MTFNIDINKSVTYPNLDIEIAKGVNVASPIFNDKRLTSLTSDFRKSIPPVGLIKLKNVFVFGNGFIMNEKRERIVSPFLPYTSLVSEKGIKLSSGALRTISDDIFRTRPLDVKEISGTAALLTQPGDRIFGHWLIDLIPMLSLIQKANKDVKYIIKNSVLDNSAIPDIGAMFKAINFESNNTIGLTENLHAYFCKELIVPSVVRYGQQIHPIVNKLYEDYREINVPISDTPLKIYFSRRKWTPSGPQRILLNAQKIEDSYQEKGFEIIHPEKLTFDEKLKLVQSATEIVGEKGSALHLSLFSQSIKKMRILLNPNESVTGLPMLQGEICRLQGIECDYSIGNTKENIPGYTIDDN